MKVVSDDKRRFRMAKCLERYGFRVQYSAFEARIDSKRYEQMIREAHALIDESEDSLRIYILHDTDAVHVWGKQEPYLDDVIIL